MMLGGCTTVKAHLDPCSLFEEPELLIITLQMKALILFDGVGLQKKMEGNHRAE